ncbi:MAG: type IV pilin protein [Pseudomonadales bacterium]|jgi:type IV pilus assembly protein PilE|nr:type IV pilin protein [Pseudomonadales bacterium]MDP6471577.1 type IV pilin protein [Pseudomonadales bacterium]MDP6828840.1 type IV pilin protein [Pseudomonadales bacterium]MDP6971718.1 type IV pilin protein [Pseudomonadales bacterium]|tara:strand:- start:686 stop:1231 length:546 start_codon:yes stop_codon:yes gene_type:complete
MRLRRSHNNSRDSGSESTGLSTDDFGSTRLQGFTLTELLVVIAILSLISAVAMPLYTAYSQRTYRAEAQADLLNCAQAMERFASEGFTYLGAADTDGDGAGDDDNGPLATTICDPLSQDQNRYDFTVTASTGGFVLTATPVDVSGNMMRDDGFLTIDDAGNREWDADDSGAIDDGEDTWES